MPYITEEQRDELKYDFVVPRNAGELNYLISQILCGYVSLNGLSYQTCADIGSALSYLDKEFYRRVVAPYEDGKIKTNGDVFQALLPEDT